jgi:hypothetical protein
MKKSGTADLPLHGGKDGHPFPVPLSVYDNSISVLRRAVNKAKIDRCDRLRSLKALGRMTELIELIEQRHDPFADVNKVIAHEWEHTREHGGMTVFGRTGTSAEQPVKPAIRRQTVQQTSLFDDV